MEWLTHKYPFELTVMRQRPNTAQAALEQADSGLKSLCLWHCKMKSMDVLARFSKLEVLLQAGWCAPDFEVLGQLKNLRRACISHLPNVRDLSPLGGLKRLEVLELGMTPTQGAYKLHAVKTLAPLGRLKSLRALSLHSIVGADGRLDVLAGARSLRTFSWGDSFSLEALGALAARRPELKIEVIRSWEGQQCKRCGGDLVFLIGLSGRGRARRACKKCQKQRIHDHAAEFERFKKMKKK